ncbi:hypothetical protein CAPTEDRAFT_191664 [Capitella teleta]|uniref:Uncharacterized protein n=1 Tax=Capitella teleta TaxID=283909 RepID=R7TI67_CAPTE|nr:hypothetical protein CAPTEDRAFT_201397 [Capitella teleta]ELU13445.1 hypothetical protein CAPTEDRAFT_191664 [Capitella teleta]|eukprot:ELT93177.1 hypothetical protein CAPTEDRAFT_201397 [Capitella teleta]
MGNWLGQLSDADQKRRNQEASEREDDGDYWEVMLEGEFSEEDESILEEYLLRYMRDQHCEEFLSADEVAEFFAHYFNSNRDEQDSGVDVDESRDSQAVVA